MQIEEIVTVGVETLYKHRLLLFFAAIFVVVAFAAQSVFAANSYNTTYNGVGDGSATNPFQITTCEQLQAVESLQAEAVDPDDARFIQTGDIDCSDTPNWDEGGFTPLTFTGGVYDGQGFVISDMTIDAVGAARAMFYNITDGATVRHIHLEDGTTVPGGSASYVASIATIVDAASTLEDCSSNINVSAGTGYAGGIAGYVSEGSTVQRCSYSGTITQSGVTGYAGGVVGFLDASTLNDSYFDGTINATGVAAYGGGVVGRTNNASEISTILTTPDSSVTANNIAGGLAGRIENNSTLSGVHAGQALGATGSGSLAGYVASASAVTGDNTAESCCGGAAYVTATGGTASANDTDESDYVGLTAATTLSSWDFDDVWQTVTDSFPTLRITTPSDSDGDGISNTIEDNGPNGGDVNDDGISDSAQANVGSSANAVNSDSVVVQNSASSGCSVSELDPQTAAEQSSSDNGFSYPVGLVDFTLGCQDNGATTDVSVYFEEDDNNASEYVARKIVNGQYETIDSATIASQTIGSKTYVVVSYSVIDGGSLDADGVANGTIIDPIGIALEESSSDSQSTLADTGQNPLLLIAFALTAMSASAILISRSQTSSA